MSLRFIIGSSGSGKSAALQRYLIERAEGAPRQQFMVLVPDQFTMQTQKEMVERHPRHGIMNIDVQSFGRLHYRIAEELGEPERLALDDTGKNLILRRLAEGLKDELTLLGGSLNKKGCIHEVKSLISEFLQYGIGPGELKRLTEYAEGRKLLAGKLSDVQRVYEAFNAYLGERYITQEEITAQLAANIPRSDILKGSVVGLDGFTGFTPVQNSVITELLRTCEEVLVTIIMPAEELEAYRSDFDEHKLFALSMNTIRSLEQLAADAGAERGEDIMLYGEPERFKGRPALAFLEKKLFRAGGEVHTGDVSGELTAFTARNPREELFEIFRQIRACTHKEALAYRDIAVISGDVERYAPYVEEASAEYGVPYFLDLNRKLEHNPVTEFMRSMLECVSTDFAYEPVMQLLRSGLSGIEDGEADELENYILSSGVRGRRAWEKGFSYIPRYLRGNEGAMLKINATRQKLVELLTPLLMLGNTADAAEYARVQYSYLSANGIYERMEAMAERFREQSDWGRAKEYEQVYEALCRLLEQITELLSGERMDITEYTAILLSGIEEIKLGVLPQDADRVVIGDMERTRLKPVKLLFFAGLNDGVVPAGISSGGLISDIDREFLSASGFALSPTPRQRMFIQRLYLYHALSRPADKLVLSNARSDAKGEAIRQSYLCAELTGLFPSLVWGSVHMAEDELPPASELACMLSDYAAGMLNDEACEKLFLYYRIYSEKEPEQALKLADAAFIRYLPPLLSAESTEGLYGSELTGSVSRMESFASCAYAHYLSYGLRLRERESNALAPVDVGTIMHDILERFGDELGKRGIRFADVSENEAGGIIDGLMDRAAAEYGGRFAAEAQGRKTMERIGRILKRSVQMISRQLSLGSFEPAAYEHGFERNTEFATKRGVRRMRLKGKIDRLDVLRDGDTLYLKVTDYKSGKKELDISELYYGRQLQLPLYLREAATQLALKEGGKSIVPAALFYYILKDPYLSADKKSAEALAAERRKLLRLSGLIRNEEAIVHGLDGAIDGESEAVHIKLKKDGSYTKTSQLAEPDDMELLLSWAEKKLLGLAAGIMEGEAGAQPLDADSCLYCAHREDCPFDTRIAGCTYRAGKLKEDEAWERIRAGGDED